MPIRLCIEGRVRKVVRSSFGGDGGAGGGRVYTGDWLMYGLTVSAVAISCLDSWRRRL